PRAIGERSFAALRMPTRRDWRSRIVGRFSTNKSAEYPADARCARGYGAAVRPGDIEERDGLTSGPARRRGAGLNPGNRFEKVRLHVLGDERERQRVERLAASAASGPTDGVDAPPADVPVEIKIGRAHV